MIEDFIGKFCLILKYYLFYIEFLLMKWKNYKEKLYLFNFCKLNININ